MIFGNVSKFHQNLDVVLMFLADGETKIEMDADTTSSFKDELQY